MNEACHDEVIALYYQLICAGKSDAVSEGWRFCIHGTKKGLIGFWLHSIAPEWNRDYAKVAQMVETMTGRNRKKEIAREYGSAESIMKDVGM